jgi:hypothetical protein
VIYRPYLLGGAVAAGLAAATAVRYAAGAVVVVALATVARPRVVLPCALALAGWW